MLKFVGVGSAFNTASGNNSGYFKIDGDIFVFDCGSANFDIIKRKKLFKDAKHVYVVMTHTHPDHVGSLGDLIFHSYFYGVPHFTPKLTVIHPSAVKAAELLDLMHVERGQYFLEEIDRGFAKGKVSAQSIPVMHMPKVPTYAYLVNIAGEGTFYYSADCNEIPADVLKMFNDGKIYRMYQDTCALDYDNNPHLSLKKLSELIPQELRRKVTCMHLDEKFDANEAKTLGFEVAEQAEA